VPIDHLPVPPPVAAWCANPNVKPIAMSKFGQEQLAKRDVESVYIPHTIEDIFRPTPDPDSTLPIPEDAFVVMMNAANKGGGGGHARKAWSENFLAMGMFMKRHPDVYFYVHTEAQCSAGIDLMSLAQAAGIDGERLSWPAQYSYRMGHFDEGALARLYTRADVLLAASMGEGFGIPVIEAEACGTRVIVSNFSAQPELASADSWLVDGQPIWNPPQQSFLFTPHVGSIVDALEEAYRADRGKSQVAISKAGEYNADRVFKQSWRPLIKEFS
jgi:glycosyltransferase involved in cell wall biosynthesis